MNLENVILKVIRRMCEMKENRLQSFVLLVNKHQFYSQCYRLFISKGTEKLKRRNVQALQFLITVSAMTGGTCT